LSVQTQIEAEQRFGLRCKAQSLGPYGRLIVATGPEGGGVTRDVERVHEYAFGCKNVFLVVVKCGGMRKVGVVECVALGRMDAFLTGDGRFFGGSLARMDVHSL
jgi:hypothetical protein